MGKFAAGLRDARREAEGARELPRPAACRCTIDGDERWWEIAASPRFDDDGAFIGFRGVGSDVTEQRASADKINRMARFDTLTGLPNRLMINETLGSAMAEADKWGGRCAFMMIDLDRFKAVNDTLGHPIGDRLLGRVSERLEQLDGRRRDCAGGSAATNSRSSCATRAMRAAVERLAQTIIETLSRPYEIDAHTLYIGASVGIAIGPRDGRTAEMLIRSADLALYRAKDAGGGVYRTYEPRTARQGRGAPRPRNGAAQGAREWRDAPRLPAGRRCRHRQRSSAFEALLRWTIREFGIISPGKVHPACRGRAPDRADRRVGAADRLRGGGALAVRHPRRGQRLRRTAPEPRLSSTTVASALANTGLSAERLELEVTESVFMREALGATKVLERILDLGVRLSLDDFGTGYSSLGYLSRTRFSSIKIDRSFVRMPPQGRAKRSRSSAPSSRSRESLDMATTAEGVETEAEHRMVQEFGCTKVQGYYFGRPLPVEEARALAHMVAGKHRPPPRQPMLARSAVTGSVGGRVRRS